MFTATMTDAEIEKEARKDFFELSTKVQIAIDRFVRMNCNRIDNSHLLGNDGPVNLLKKSVENRKWKTRRGNEWTSSFRFKNGVGTNIEIEGYLYIPILREKGTEYIFQSNLKSPIAERFTMHFIQRYKERHLQPHNIDIGAMPAPLYFQMHNPNPILGKYYKPADIEIVEGKNKRFWIVREGIYVTDYIEGMLTYITFMDKDDLSPLKKQVYEEEIVWDLIVRVVDKKLSDFERTKAAFSLYNSPDFGRIFERFCQRNFKDGEEKQKLLSYARTEMVEIKEKLEEMKEKNKQKEKVSDRNAIFSAVFDAKIRR